MIVFDECHHTRKNHAYNGIMREYFQIPPNERPKIFGMTASPIWNPKNAADSLATLEKNLDGKIVAVKEHLDELADHSPKPEEVRTETRRRCVTPNLLADHLRIPGTPGLIPRILHQIATTAT